MITAKFFTSQGFIKGFEVSGHAMFDDYGKDIVCAGVSSAVQMCANGLSEIAKLEPKIEVGENTVAVSMKDNFKDTHAQLLLKTLQLHLEVLSQEYSDTITLTNSEVQ